MVTAPKASGMSPGRNGIAPDRGLRVPHWQQGKHNRP
jgi:hypothetical protein